MPSTGCEIVQLCSFTLVNVANYWLSSLLQVADNGDAGVDGLQQKLIQKSELQKKENLRVEDAAFQPGGFLGIV